MYHEFNIPFEWGQQSHNFITYHGDIYPGNITFCPKYKDGFFIVPNVNGQTLRALKPEEKTPERYNQLGWEIKDISVFQHKPIPSQPNFGAHDDVRPPSVNGRAKWKKLFVFGAGASASCCFGDSLSKFNRAKLRPPVGKDIFHSRYSKIIENYPGVEDTLPFFEANGFDIEACLQSEWDEIRSSFNKKITARHTNVQFYLADLFGKISNHVLTNYKRGNLYGLFSSALQKYLSKRGNRDECVGVVSFNYDSILDNFIRRDFNIKLDKIEDYVDWKNNQLVLFKPHGSWNWGWPFVEGKLPVLNQIDISNHLYEKEILPANIYYDLLGKIPDIVYSGSWALERNANTDDVGRYTINKNRIKYFGHESYSYFPALLMPYRDKDEFVMPYLHMMCMREYLREVEDLYLIGWKGNEDSFNKFIKKYANNLKRIIIVNPDSESVKDNLRKILSIEKYSFETVDTFEEFACKKMNAFLK